MITVLHLTASPFFGGPERQMLGLGRALSPDYRSVYASYAENGAARPFLARARENGFTASELRWNFPRFRRCVQELVELLREQQADVLCSHGYKPDLLGWLAARRLRLPIVAVSRGWTGCTWRVRVYDALDRWCLRWLDAVVCVSEGQALKVRRTGVYPSKVHVIRNAIDAERFNHPNPRQRRRLETLFAQPVRHIVGTAGRFSPEKGFDQLVAAAALVTRERRDIGFVLFGDGPLRGALEEQVARLGLQERVILAGFRSDLDEIIPALDVFALSSHTEGLPNVVLEAFAAGVPVVATAVGGTPEVVDDGVSGFLVPAGDPNALARRLLELLVNEEQRQEMGRQGQERVQREFTFAAQAEQYRELFERVLTLAPMSGASAPGH